MPFAGAQQKAFERADGLLAALNLDAETKDKLREPIARAIMEERRIVNNEIQHRLSNFKVSVVEDLEMIRQEIERLLHPKS